MEEIKPYASSTQVSLPTYTRRRHVPDVPEEVDDDYLMEHLNDPNLDLTRQPSHHSKAESVELGTKKGYPPSDIDAESHYDSDRYSTSRAESRNSTAIEFDECVSSFYSNSYY